MLRLGATLLAVSLLGVTGGGVVGSADAQGVAELFGKVAPTVVVAKDPETGSMVSDAGASPTPVRLAAPVSPGVALTVRVPLF